MYIVQLRIARQSMRIVNSLVQKNVLHVYKQHRTKHRFHFQYSERAKNRFDSAQFEAYVNNWIHSEYMQMFMLCVNLYTKHNSWSDCPRFF